MRRDSELIRRVVHSPWLRKVAVTSPAVRELAASYFAGASIFDAAREATRLSRQGLDLSFSYLAPDGRPESLRSVFGKLLQQLGPVADGAELSVKPSCLGARNSSAEAEQQLRALCRTAAEFGALITLEMQRPTEYDATVVLWQKVRADFPQLGITLPVNLKRVERDCRRFGDKGARIRLCVGSYEAQRGVAHVSEHEKSLALVRCLRTLMESEAYPMLATHDSRVIEIAQELAYRNSRPSDSYEFQLLYGVRPLEQRRLVDIGLRCRTYVPFGPSWYQYLSARIAARPRTLVSYLRALLDKR